MASKEEITETIKSQLTNVRERGRVLAQALKARTDIAATRRRLRAAFADLGQEVYGRMKDGGDGPWNEDEEMATYRTRIEGVQAELKQRERVLKDILEDKGKKEEAAEPVEEEAEKDKEE